MTLGRASARNSSSRPLQKWRSSSLLSPTPFPTHDKDLKNKGLSVSYREMLSPLETATQISALPSPYVLLWYCGVYGLKKEGVKFYKDFLISPIFSSNKQSTFWLVDLAAWGALQNPKIALSKVGFISEDIQHSINGRFQTIHTADIFTRMQRVSDETLIEYFTSALQRDFIHKSSEAATPANTTVGDLFHNDCPILSPWYETDAAKSYSTIQYLEAFFLIETLIQQHLARSPTEDIQIALALPNDETKYYQDETQAFQQDLEFFIQHRFPHLLESIKITATFFPFEYGTASYQRPYNARGKVYKKSELSYQDIVDYRAYIEDVEKPMPSLLAPSTDHPKISFSLPKKLGELQIELETQRLYIRSYKDEDFEKSAALYGDPVITKLFDYGVPRTKAEVLELVSSIGHKHFRKGEPFGLFSIFRKSDMSFIGHLDLLPTAKAGILEIGFILHEQYQGQNFGTEAVKAFIYEFINELSKRGYSYRDSSITEVIATVHPDNIPSKRVLEKSGMKFERFQIRFGQPRMRYTLKLAQVQTIH